MSGKKLYISENYIWSMEGYLRVFLGLKTGQLSEKRQEHGRRFSHEDLETDSFLDLSIARFPLSELRIRKELLRNGLVVLVKDYKGHEKPYIVPSLLAYFSASDAKRMLLTEECGAIMMKILKMKAIPVAEVSFTVSPEESCRKRCKQKKKNQT